MDRIKRFFTCIKVGNDDLHIIVAFGDKIPLLIQKAEIDVVSIRYFRAEELVFVIFLDFALLAENKCDLDITLEKPLVILFINNSSTGN